MENMFFEIYDIPHINIIRYTEIFIFFSNVNYSADNIMLFKNVLLFTYILWGGNRVSYRNLNRK